MQKLDLCHEILANIYYGLQQTKQHQKITHVVATRKLEAHTVGAHASPFIVFAKLLKLNKHIVVRTKKPPPYRISL